MSQKGSGGWVAVVIGLGAALHKAHDAVDGYEWLADMCWCRLRRYYSA